MSKKQRRYWMRVGFMAIFTLLLGFAVYKAILNDRPDVLKEGEVAPDFTAETLDGTQTSLSEYRGKGVLLNFWATWCGPCKAEMPAIDRGYQQYKDHGYEVLAVNVGESPLSIKGFARGLDLSFPLLLDPNKDTTGLYKIGPLPSSVFVKPDGTIYKIVKGQMNDAFIEQQILHILPES